MIVSRFRRNRKTPLSRANGKTAKIGARTPKKGDQFMKSITQFFDDEIVLWALAGGFWGLFLVIVAAAVLQ